jgi:hypothetical protein
MLSKSSTKRPSIEKVLEHPWFAEYFHNNADVRRKASNPDMKFAAYSTAHD